MKFDTIYIEKDIINSSKVTKLLSKIKSNNVITCENYREVFNPKNQNFRIQKKNQSIILAKKKTNLILKTPKEFSIGFQENYYFSHMLNCIYDCKYCFLQGMYNSANIVLFVNFDDFADKIRSISLKTSKSLCFFSGYDCDSLALENITNFSDYFFKIFKDLNHSYLELRTKSININSLSKKKPIPNIIIAFSLSPDEIINSFEDKTPSFKKRIKTIAYLQKIGWNIGLRFDPLILTQNFKTRYINFFREVFLNINSEKIHSITIGSFRMPSVFFDKIKRIRPFDTFLHSKSLIKGNLISYDKKKEIENFCFHEIKKYSCENKIYFN